MTAPESVPGCDWALQVCDGVVSATDDSEHIRALRTGSGVWASSTHGQNDVAIRVPTDPGGSGAEQMLPVATAG